MRMTHTVACPCLIALTRYGQPSDREQALAAGFAAHLTKPVDLEVLHEVCWSIRVGTAADQMANRPA